MAKKTVASLHSGNAGKTHAKVIKMVKNPETGRYVFNEKMIPNEDVKSFFK